MRLNTAERALLKKLGPNGLRVWKIIEEAENDSVPIIGIARLLQLLGNPPLNFITFSCLASIRGKEELILDPFASYFLRGRKMKEAEKFIQEMQKITPASLAIILPDLEPARTWGWQTPQEEITLCCQLMAEETTGRLPEGWRIVLWSEIERQWQEGGGYENAVDRTRCQELLIYQEANHLKKFPEILFRGGHRAAAERQIAAYAFEGQALEKIIPGAILIQSESPADRKDKMYQLLRQEPLPIIHPLTLG